MKSVSFRVMLAAVPQKDSVKGFEPSLKELEKLLADLDRDDTPLHEMVAGYEKGVKLLKTCRNALDEARLRVEVLRKKVSGEPETDVFEEEGETLL